MDQFNTTSQVSNITRKTRGSHIGWHVFQDLIKSVKQKIIIVTNINNFVRHKTELTLMTSEYKFFVADHTFFVRAFLLCFQMYYFMPFNTFLFRQRHVIQKGLIVF